MTQPTFKDLPFVRRPRPGMPEDPALPVERMLAQRRRNGSWTAEEVLIIARRTEFRVHKYAWKQEKLRKLTRRMAKEGKLVLLGFETPHFIYKATT